MPPQRGLGSSIAFIEGKKKKRKQRPDPYGVTQRTNPPAPEPPAKKPVGFSVGDLRLADQRAAERLAQREFVNPLLKQIEDRERQARIRANNVAAQRKRLLELARAAGTKAGAKNLQTALNARHGADLTVDGIIGDKTQAAFEKAFAQLADKEYQGFSRATAAGVYIDRNERADERAKRERDYIKSFLDRAYEEAGKIYSAPEKLNFAIPEEAAAYDNAAKTIEQVKELRALVDSDKLDNLALIDLAVAIREGEHSSRIEGLQRRIAEARAEGNDEYAKVLEGMLAGLRREIAMGTYEPPTASELGAVEDASGPLGLFGLESPILGALDDVFGRFSAYFAALQMTESRNPLLAVQGFAAKTVGAIGVPFTDLRLENLIAPKGSTWRKASDATNTEAERSELVRRGQILSPGQVLSGKETEAYRAINGELRGPNLPSFEFETPFGRADFTSGALDFAVQVVFDPATIASGAVSGLRNVGLHAGEAALRQAPKELVERFGEEAIQRMGRSFYLDASHQGRAIMAEVTDAVGDLSRTGDVRSMTKTIKGLDTETAARAIAAREAAEGGTEAATRAAAQVIRDAFVEGIWQPKISIRRQVRNYVTRGRAGADVVVHRNRGSLVRRLANEAYSNNRVIAMGAQVAEFIPRALEVAARAAGKTWRSVWAETPLPWVTRGLGAADTGTASRFWNVMQYAEDAGDASLLNIIELRLAPFFNNPRLIDRVGHSRYLDALFGQADFEQALREVETLVAIHSGRAGKAAQSQLLVDLSRGFQTETRKQLEKRAAANLGVSNTVGGIKRGLALLDGDTAELAEALAETLALKGKAKTAGLRKLGAVVRKALKENSEAYADELARLARMPVATSAADAPIRAGLGRRAVARVAQTVLDVSESIAPEVLKFTPSENALNNRRLVVENLDRWAAALRLDDATRVQLRAEAGRISTEREFFEFRERVVRLWADRHNIDGDKFLKLLRSMGKMEKPKKPVRAILGDADEEVEKLQTISQLIESMSLPTADDLAAALRKAILDGTQDASLAERLNARLHVAIDAVGNIGFDLGDGKRITFAGGIRAGHNIWKFMVVTNGFDAIVGGAYAFFSTDGDIDDRMKAAGIGAALGATGSIRYISRVVGIEERLRSLMTEGFIPDQWIPGYARIRMRLGGGDPHRRFMSDNLIRAGAFGETHFANDFLLQVEKGFTKLGPNDARYVDSWWRIVNFQLHPESDLVARILLAERAGLYTRKQADKLLVQFFKSDEGKLWRTRFASGLGGTSSMTEAATRYRTFIEKYVPPDIAAMRVLGGKDTTRLIIEGVETRPAQVPRETLKRSVKAGDHPGVIHGQKSSRLPKSARALYRNYQEIVGRGVLSGPTTMLNRRPYANYVFRKKYDNLIRAGVDPAKAQRIADEYAVKRTNEVMVQLADESRFAQKVDFWLPFQQPREELLRVWAKIGFENPRRMLKLADDAARIFNSGVASGALVKDEMTGEYEMAVPYSGQLSRTLFGLPFEVPMEANVRDLLFFGSGAFGIGVVPSPGGPYWGIFSNKLADAHPEMFEKETFFTKLLWPYGPRASLGNRRMSRLAMAFTGSVPPWEFASQDQWEDELRKWETNIAIELVNQHRMENPEDLDWFPSDAEIKSTLKDFYKAWAFWQGVTPASPRPVMTSRERFQSALNAFTLEHKVPLTGVLYSEFIKKYPEFELHLRPTTKYVGPDDYESWQLVGEDALAEYTQKEREHISVAEFREEFKQNRRTSEYYRQLFDTLDAPLTPLEREQALYELAKKYPDVRANIQNEYARDKELTRILTSYPDGAREEAIDRWRRQYNVKHSTYLKLAEKARRGTLVEVNPWKEARFAQEIVADVEKHTQRGNRDSVARYVATLSPVEQAKYWQYQRDSLTFDPETEDPKPVLEKYDYFNSQYFSVRNHYSWIFNINKRKPNAFEEAVKKVERTIDQQTGDAYDQINVINRQMDEAVAKKQWGAYNALKARRQQLYDYVSALQNFMYRKFPVLAGVQRDLQAMSLYGAEADDDTTLAVLNLMSGKTGIQFLPTSEEKRWLYMPQPVRDAYAQELVDALDMPPSDDGFDREVNLFLKERHGIRKMFWDYLTPFQQFLMEHNFPDRVDQWKMDAIFREQGGFEGKRGGRGVDGSKRFSMKDGELSLAITLFKEYNRRGNMPEPAAYKEYLELPKNPAVRADFLKKHPEVAEYIKLGPLANMPPLYRELVINIMVKYGKWDGEVRSVEEVTDLAWAREQLARWTRRPKGAMAPETYDLWLNMPSGPEKAAYLRDHPEIQEWIALGPMANMPEAYQEVVRDIMLRYGEWTANTDPLSVTLQEFARTPRAFRDKFLLEHPELEVYFAATRTPDEQRMFEMVDTYMNILDVNAKRAYLASHPELQQWFVEQRTKRYERFLNQVALYMGANPEMFEEYLERQEDVLTELLERFGEPSLVREMLRQERPLELQSEKSGDSGRVRRNTQRN